MDTLLYVLAFVLASVVPYFLDKSLGVKLYRPFYEKLYRPFYNMWHTEPLLEPEGVVRGFIVGRKARERILPAIVSTIVACFLLHYYIHDPIELVMKSLPIFVGFFIGFLLIGLAMREGKKTNTVVDKVCAVMDDIEDGKIDLTGAASDAIKRGVVETRHALSQVADGAAEKVAALRTVKPEATPAVNSTDAGDQPVASPPLAKPEPKKSFEDALDAFRNRR